MKAKLLFLLFSIFSLHFIHGQSDCSTAIASCGNSTISYTPNGYGNSYESIGGCMYYEHYSVWHSFTIATSGTLTFVIDPNSSNDYDFAVFGPNKTCGNLGTPIRCSYASTSSGYNTGLNMTANDLTEGAGGDGFVKYLDVNAGETYYLVVDNFSQSANGFTLTWGGTATIASPFNNTPQPFNPPGNAGSNSTAPREIPLCSLPAVVDLSTLTAGILNGNTGFTVTYHTTSNGALTGTNPITAPVTVNNTNTIYYYSISAGNSACRQTGSFKFVLSPPANNAALSKCTTDGTGQALFDLTEAQTAITNQAGATFRYYTTLADAQANNNNFITNPTNYLSGNTILYVRVMTTGCTAQLTLTVNSTATPTITASATNICYGGSPITLTVNQTTGLLWSTGETTPSITVNQAGTYTVTYNNGVCTSAPASITITSDINPNIQITGNNTFCVGGSTSLSATTDIPNPSFSWSNGATTPSITVTNQGNYTVTITSPSGCVYTNSATVTELPLPTANDSTLSQCSLTGTATYDLTSAQPSINGGAGITYTYYENLADAQANNANTINNTTSYTSNPTTIYVVVSNGNCKSIANLTLDIPTNTVPTITASSTVICFGGTVTLTSNIANGNSWSNGATTPTITISTPGTYTLVNTAGTCISQTASITITGESDPNVVITGNLNFCGSNSTLTASSSNPANTYLWSNGSTNTTTTVNASGTYTVTVTTPSGCTYQKSVNVLKEQDININIATPQQLSCNVTQMTLNANGSTFPSGSTIVWTASSGGTIVSGGNTLTPTINSAGTYTLTITSPMGCSSNSSVAVTANTTAPIVSVNATALTICEGETVQLIASGASSYIWNNTTSTSSTQTVSPTVTTTYTVSGIGSNGCNSSNNATITIEVLPRITSTITDIDFCNSTIPVLDAGSGPNYTYLWSTGETTQSITVPAAGTYTVTISNGTCSETFTAHAFMNIPTINEVLYDNNSLTIIATGNNSQPLEYSIDNGFTWQSSNTFANVVKNNLYKIYVRYKFSNCNAEQDFYTLFIPNVITPNGDGINDTLDLTSLTNYEDFKGTIFDRYGKTVFVLTKQNPKWTGTYTGRAVPTGTYWYNFQWTDPLSKKLFDRSGWIMIKNRD